MNFEFLTRQKHLHEFANQALAPAAKFMNLCNWAEVIELRFIPLTENGFIP